MAEKHEPLTVEEVAADAQRVAGTISLGALRGAFSGPEILDSCAALDRLTATARIGAEAGARIAALEAENARLETAVVGAKGALDAALLHELRYRSRDSHVVTMLDDIRSRLCVDAAPKDAAS